MNNRNYLEKDLQWAPEHQPITGRPLKKKNKTRLRFKPKGMWPFLSWGVALFLGFRILFLPLVTGVYNLVIKSQELSALKAQHQKMSKQLAEMKKTRDYMKTIAYVEEQSHKAGFIKVNESPMLVISAGEKELPDRNKDIESGE